MKLWTYGIIYHDDHGNEDDLPPLVEGKQPLWWFRFMCQYWCDQYNVGHDLMRYEPVAVRVQLFHPGVWRDQWWVTKRSWSWRWANYKDRMRMRRDALVEFIGFMLDLDR